MYHYSTHQTVKMGKDLFFLIMLMSIMISAKGKQCECPDGCICKDGAKNVVCSKLKEFPRLCNGTSSVDIQESSISELKATDKLPASVSHLSIQGCQVASVDDRFFPKGSNLSFLSLANNELKTVNEKCFANLLNLQQLDLSNNLVTKLSSLTAKLRLTTLALNGNKIPHEEVTSALCRTDRTRLRTLRLDSMDLGEFPTGIVDCDKGDNNVLSYVSLSDNKITSLPRLSSLNLETLFLSSNRLQHIPDGSFSVSLQYLTLANNPLGNNSLLAIQKLRNLKHLDLAGVNYTHFPKTMFQLMTNLEFLNLSKCNISSFHKGMFNTLGNVKVLYLQSNQLQEFPFKDMAPMKYLEEVYMDHNKLHYIRESQDAAILLYHLKKLDVSHNPFYCDCPLRWICRWLRYPYRTTTVFNEEETRCLRPYADVPINQLDVDDCDLTQISLAIILGGVGSLVLISFICCVLVCCCRYGEKGERARERVAVNGASGYQSI